MGRLYVMKTLAVKNFMIPVQPDTAPTLGVVGVKKTPTSHWICYCHSSLRRSCKVYSQTQPMPTDAAGQRLRFNARVAGRFSLAFNDEAPCPNLCVWG